MSLKKTKILYSTNAQVIFFLLLYSSSSLEIERYRQISNSNISFGMCLWHYLADALTYRAKCEVRSLTQSRMVLVALLLLLELSVWSISTSFAVPMVARPLRKLRVAVGAEEKSAGARVMLTGCRLSPS